jgi:RND family efflux transporter MFP subunit
MSIFITGRRHMPNGGMLSLLFAAACACGLYAMPVAAESAGDEKPALGPETIRAQLLPRRYTTLAAEIAARVTRITVPEGGNFKSGEALVVFDCSLPKAQLRRAQAELQGARQVFASNQKLASLNSVGQLELDVSQTAVAKAEAEVGLNETLLSKCAVAAPFGGRVAEQKIREGQFVQIGQPLLEILDDQSLELEFLVPSQWLTWLKPGSALSVHIDETNKTYPARFTRIGARIDPVSQSVKVAASIDGKFPELIAGMSGEIQTQVP